MSAIRVLMVDDHPVDWEGLYTALDQANDVVVVGEARSGQAHPGHRLHGRAAARYELARRDQGDP